MKASVPWIRCGFSSVKGNSSAFETSGSEDRRALAQLAYSSEDFLHETPDGRRNHQDAQAQLGHTRLSTTLEIYTLARTRTPAHRRRKSGSNGDQW